MLLLKLFSTYNTNSYYSSMYISNQLNIGMEERGCPDQNEIGKNRHLRVSLKSYTVLCNQIKTVLAVMLT